MLVILTVGELASYDKIEAVVPKTLGKLERVVGMGVAGSIRALVKTETEIYRAHGTLGDVVDLALKEGVKGTVHREPAGIAIGEIHACGEHGDGELATLLHTHGCQLVLDTHVIGGIEGKLQSHVSKGLSHLHTTLEVDTAATGGLCTYEGFHLLSGSEVEAGIHDVAIKLNITSFLDGEGLEGDDGQLIFHLTLIECITTEELELVGGVIDHTQFTASFEIDVVGLSGIEGADDTCSLLDVHEQQHIETLDDGTFGSYADGIAEISEGDKLLQLVVGAEGGVFQYVCHVGGT